MLELAEIEAARERIGDLVRETPIDHSRTFSELSGASVYCKLETFQKTGSFKLRGATNRIRTLSADDRAAGVITASAGNHAQGVALAATASDVEATVVMPEAAPVAKVAATRGYGAKVCLHGTDYQQAQTYATELATEQGLTYVHAFDDPAIIAGQGTIALELLEALPTLDTVLVPIGGGGLIAGVLSVIAAKRPEVRVIGVQAEGAASVSTSLERGELYERDRVDTIADGIATRRIGELPFTIIRDHIDAVVDVSDAEIAVAVTHLLERSKLLVEPAGAASLAALLSGRVAVQPEETVVPILSGGNVDLNVLSTILLRGLIETGRYLRLRTVLKDRPGELERLSGLLAAERANIYAIRHERTARDVALNDAEVELDLETRGLDHVTSVCDRLREEGYPVEILS